MSEGKGTPPVCQRCGGVRGPSRYCPHCGLDFWKAAEAEANLGAATMAAAQGPVVVGSGGTPVAMLAIGAGFALLAIAAVVWIIATSGLLSGGGREGGQQLGNAPPPAVHPLVLDFFSEARDPEAAYAWRQEGSVTVTVPDREVETEFTASGRVDGKDQDTSIRLVEDGELAFDGDIIVVDQHGYVRTTGDEWVETGRIPGAQLTTINPFARITTVAELEYVGEETRDGVEGHVLTTDKWLSDPALDDPIRELAHVRSREALMEVFVDADGVPLSALYTYSLEARTPDGEIVTMAGETNFSFSDWDAVEPIVAPSGAAPAVDP